MRKQTKIIISILFLISCIIFKSKSQGVYGLKDTIKFENYADLGLIVKSVTHVHYKLTLSERGKRYKITLIQKLINASDSNIVKTCKSKFICSLDTVVVKKFNKILVSGNKISIYKYHWLWPNGSIAEIDSKRKIVSKKTMKKSEVKWMYISSKDSE